MSESARSEVLKTVSEVGDSGQVGQESQNNTLEKREESPRSVVVDESKKSVDGTIVGSRSPRVGMSRTGSQFLPGLHNATLPSKMAIIVGLCQVAVGGAMVLTGILAIRYQSYLFHYGTGLWAGLLSAITGILGAMCTKKGVPKPNWLCGGRKWQIHVFLLAILLSLSSVVLLAIFSTSGLLQDARTIMAVEIEDQSQLEEILDSKNTAGIVINTVLLLLSILQVLLCFSSLGIAVRVLFKSRRNSSLLSSKESTGSEIAIREEYRARKDHLIHWLGHNGQNPSGKSSHHWQNIIPLGFNGGAHPQKSMPKYPTLVAIQPVAYPPQHHNNRRMIAYPSYPTHQPSMILPPQYAMGPQMIPMPICAVHGATPTPSIIMSSHRRGTPGGSIVSLAMPRDGRRPRRRSHNNNSIVVSNNGHPTSVRSFGTQSHRSSKAPSVISAAKTESEKNNELEIEEVDISCTYTGLDAAVADDYISSMTMYRKRSPVDDFSDRGSSDRN